MLNLNGSGKPPPRMCLCFDPEGNRWVIVPDEPVVRLRQMQPPLKVLTPDDEVWQPEPVIDKLVVLKVRAEADLPSRPYRSTATTGLLVREDELKNVAGAPPEPVERALFAFVKDDRWPTTNDYLIVGIEMAIPPSFIVENDGFGGEIDFPEEVW